MKDIDRGFAKFMKEMLTLKKQMNLQVGLFKEAGTNDGQYVSDYAYFNEFGTDKIPSRPFMRMATDQNEKKWVNSLEDGISKSINNSISLNTAIIKTADQMIDDIKKSIDSNIPPQNKPSTIKRKKSSKTLIDTGIMRSSINYRVVG